MSQNPFSFYDFLGYLIPGGMFLFLLFLFGVSLDLQILKDIAKMVGNNIEAISLLNYASLVIISYLTGHFISMISAFFIEKYMNDSLQYPSIYLFWEINDRYKTNSRGKLFDRESWRSSKIIKARIKYLVIKLTLLPFIILDFCTNRVGYSRELPKPLAKVIWQRIKKGYIMKFEIEESSLDKKLEGDLFRLAYHYVYEHSSHHQSKIQNYVALYGFCRNISFVLLVFFWISFSIFIHSMFNKVTGGYFLICMALFLTTSYIFYCGFVKFYRRYTLEVLMAFSVIKLD